MTILPVGNRVLVKPDKEEETKSGILLTSSSIEKKAQGKVITYGQGWKGTGLKVGDIVLFGKYAGDDIELEEEGQKVEYKMLEEMDILAVLRD